MIRLISYLFLTLSIIGCNNALYYPITQSAPTLKSKGELQTILAGGMVNGSILAAYSPLERWGTSVSAQLAKNHWQIEASNGYYLARKNILWDVYIGMGYMDKPYSRSIGSGFNDSETYATSGKAFKYFLQPGIHKISEKSEVSFNARFELADYKEFILTKWINSGYYYSSSSLLKYSLSFAGRAIYSVPFGNF